MPRSNEIMNGQSQHSRDSQRHRLLVLIVLYIAASFIHFMHNAESLADYPNLPEQWTRFGVYAAWIGMTAISLAGLWILSRGIRLGLGLIALHAILGIDSLGHYVLAPMHEHTSAMNFTILLEVGAGTLVLFEVIRQVFGLRAEDSPLPGGRGRQR